MERNPKAVCKNCPYWAEDDLDPNTAIEIISASPGMTIEFNRGRCHHGPFRPLKKETDWCGQHPDFPVFPVAHGSNFKEPE